VPEDSNISFTAKVAIVTRTKDRELTLQRTAACVMAQTYPDILWVVVNDGGVRGHVDSLAAMVRESGRAVLVIHHEQSKGRPAAANAGIVANACPWIILLDDDDTVEPQFVKRCMDYLEQSEFPYEGVAVWTDIIHERICNDKIVSIGRYPGYQPTEVSFITLFYTNLFPPSSFVFSRKGWDVAGRFDERLHCSEDWNFNQRLLVAGPIGIIPEVLACLHHRIDSEYEGTVYANTVVHGLGEHQKYYQFWRDELIRNELRSGRLGLGQLNLLALIYFNSQCMRIFSEIAAMTKEDIESVRLGTRAVLKLVSIFGKVLKKFALFYIFLSAIFSKMKRLLNKFVQLFTAWLPRTSGNHYCPVCDSAFDRFAPLPDKYKQYIEAGGKYTCNDLEMLAVATHHCPKCYSADRDRFTAWYLQKELNGFQGNTINVLEFAPHPAVSKFLKSASGVRHSTCDLFMDGVDYKCDITHLKEIPDGSFQVIICSHVLEHVYDDMQAMREMKRILSPGGKAVVLVPIYRPLNECYENPSIINPEERKRHFGQGDHIRLYSRSCFVSRLSEVGFSVECIGLSDIGQETFDRLGLVPTSTLYVAHKPR